MMKFGMTIITDENAFFEFGIDPGLFTIGQGSSVQLKIFPFWIFVMKSQCRKVLLVSTNRTTTSESFYAKNFSFPSSRLLKMIGLVNTIFASRRTMSRLSARKRFAAGCTGYDFFHNLIITQ